MHLGLCVQPLYCFSFPAALRAAADIGAEAIELPVHRGNPFIDLDDALAGSWRRLERQIRSAGLRISALSNHTEGQLLLGPHGIDTDAIHDGSAVEKTQFATERLCMTARLAERLGVPVVCGFTGCEDYSRWFPWPLRDGYERMASVFRERMLPILDTFAEHDVRFAHECHPRQFAYNLETARWAVDLVDDHPAFGFNYDPANLALAGMDPIAFLAELGDRVLHVHAKDCENVAQNTARSGLLAHGAWSRRDRGFRFRIPGWGDLSWKRIISELRIAGYDGVLAIEHEDPTMARLEGLRQAAAYLEPLLLREPVPDDQWW